MFSTVQWSLYLKIGRETAVSTREHLSLVLLKKLDDIESLLALSTNNQDYLASKLSSIEEKNQEISKLLEAQNNANEQLKAEGILLKNLPQWYSVSAVAEAKGLSSDAVRKQLKNGEFEDGVDFKMPDGTILIHQGAVERIHRRRSSNG